MRASLQVDVAAIFLEQICIIRYYPLISDDASTGKSHIDPAASTVQWISIRNNSGFAAQKFGKSPFAVAQFAVFVSAATVMMIDVTLRMQHVLDD